MTWRDNLLAGTFRGAGFLLDSAESSTGRRTVVHEFPSRDEPQVEDLGRLREEFGLEMYVIGPDYMVARDALIVALRAPGPAELVHPYLGQLTVRVAGEIRWVESSREGGMARFTARFVAAAPVVYPRRESATPEATESAADAAEAASGVSFTAVFSAAGQPNYVGNAAVDQLRSLARDLRAASGQVTSLSAPYAAYVAALDTFSSSAGELIGSPADLAADILSLVATLNSLVSRPRDALAALRTLFGWQSGAPATDGDTQADVALAANQVALQELVAQTAAAEACRAVSRSDYASYDDAVALRDELVTELDQRVESGVPDSVYLALTALRSAICADIQARGADLARLVTITLPESVPAIVLAWRLYGDSGRDAALIERNALSDPFFTPALVPLEALSE